MEEVNKKELMLKAKNFYSNNKIQTKAIKMHTEKLIVKLHFIS